MLLLTVSKFFQCQQVAMHEIAKTRMHRDRDLSLCTDPAACISLVILPKPGKDHQSTRSVNPARNVHHVGDLLRGPA